MNSAGQLDKTINKNIVSKGDRKVVHCCEKMAKEIFNHPYEKYSYLNEGDGIKWYLKKNEDGSFTSIENCPFCDKETYRG